MNPTAKKILKKSFEKRNNPKNQVRPLTGGKSTCNCCGGYMKHSPKDDQGNLIRSFRCEKCFHEVIVTWIDTAAAGITTRGREARKSYAERQRMATIVIEQNELPLLIGEEAVKGKIIVPFEKTA